MSALPELVPNEWITEQQDLAARVVAEDTVRLEDIRYVGGCDLSFSTSEPNVAVACITVLSRKDRRECVIRERQVKIDVPFIPGFLAFREAPVLVDMWKTLRAEAAVDATVPFPDVILLDGNGLLHPRGCGVACHLGVVLGVPTIGVAKTYFSVDGITGTQIKEKCSTAMTAFGDWMSICGPTRSNWGAVVRSSKPFSTTTSVAAPADVMLGFKGYIHAIPQGTSPHPAPHEDSVFASVLPSNVEGIEAPFKPIYVSVGHGLALSTAVHVVLEMCTYRVPEPIRIADKVSRASVARVTGV
jgi:deoxyinosine 3'endonuclease (endonuclease V)